MRSPNEETPPADSKDGIPSDTSGETVLPGSGKSLAAADRPTPEPDKKPVSKRPKRTAGMHVVDTIIYPLVNNVGVFVISMIATYKTSKFAPEGGWLRLRGEWMESQFRKLNFSKEGAENGRIVTLSFLDGSFIAPLVAWFEGKRNPMARRIDRALGTAPDDDTVYKEEPKQGLRSILGGRAATAAIVVPVAIALERNHFPGRAESWNKTIFYNLGADIGRKAEQRMPRLKKFLGGANLEGVGMILLFEAFFTSLCTASLALISRPFARWLNKHDAKKADHAQSMKDAAGTTTGSGTDSSPKEFPEAMATLNAAADPQNFPSPVAAALKEREPEPAGADVKPSTKVEAVSSALHVPEQGHHQELAPLR